MKLQVLQEDFKKAVIIASRFSSARPQIPVLSNLLFSTTDNNLAISATNLEISINLKIGAKVEEKGDITVPSKSLAEIVSNLNPGVIRLKSEKEHLILEAENFKSKLLGINASEFPKVPKEMTGSVIEIPFGSLVQSLSKVVFASSYDETRPILTGILLMLDESKLSLVATDGYRLSVSCVEGKYQNDVKKLIIPKFIFSEIPRIAAGENINFSFDTKNNLVLFETKDAILSSRVIEGEYPDFQKIIPTSFRTKVLIDKDDFLRLIKLSSVFARDSGNVIKISIKSNLLDIFAESQNSGSQRSSAEVKVEGDDIEIAFNYKFLEDFLNSVSGETVSLELNDSSSPVVFKDTSDKNYLHLIMPVKI
jgi:DNA polymerase-3 subunit beta